MFTRTVSTDDLTRFKREREDADRQYNDALTALDRALQRLRDVPHPPPPYDEHQLTPLNERWDLLAVKPVDRGWRGRLRSVIWSAVAPLFERQHAFNAALVEHLNRNTSVHREVAASAATTLAFMHEELAKAIEFQSRIVQYLQTITPYVDTKDREIAGLMRRINEDIGEFVDEFFTHRVAPLDQRVAGLAGALGDVAEELDKRSESMTARERRYDAREQQYVRQVEDVRASFAVVNQVAQTLKRELERLHEASPSMAPSKTPGAVRPVTRSAARNVLVCHRAHGAWSWTRAPRRARPYRRRRLFVMPVSSRKTRRVGSQVGAAACHTTRAAATSGRSPVVTPENHAETAGGIIVSSLDSHKYVGFEDLYRGSTEDIRNRLSGYLEDFVGSSDVVDIGCGRGEFLELLRDRGIAARGIDNNHEMVEVCTEHGLVCEETDALSFLRAQTDASVGGLFSAQVVEHLEPAYLLKLLDTAYLKLRPGATMILETINAASWSAFFHSYIRDITHVRPLHPETLEYLVSASGFQNVRVRYLSPYPDDFKLHSIPVPAQSSDGAPSPSVPFGVAVTLNENVEKLNHLLFADQDYAVIAERR